MVSRASRLSGQKFAKHCKDRIKRFRIVNFFVFPESKIQIVIVKIHTCLFLTWLKVQSFSQKDLRFYGTNLVQQNLGSGTVSMTG